MASVVERREHSRRSRSPPRGRERRVTPPRRRSSPARRTGSPARARSPVKASLRERSSPPREKAKEQARSPKHAREQSRSPSPARRRDSRSPSPYTKRLRRAQGEREVFEADRGKAAHREERNSGRHREHDEERDALRDRKGVREVAQVTDSDRRKASHKEERDSWRHREHDDRRDAVRDRKAEREGVQVNECGDRRKASHKEGDSGRHREHHVEGSDLSRDRKVERVDSRGAAKDGKSDCDDGRDHSRDRKAGRDERSSASREALSCREDERYDSRGGRSDRDDRKAASSREQRVDLSDRRDSTRGRMADREESNVGSGRSSRHGRSLSPEEHRHRGRHESHSSPRASRSTISHAEDVNSRGDEVSRGGDADSVAMMKAAAEALEAKEKQKPSFELSGKLAEETNRVAGVNLLYSEPPEARKSDIRWRLYVFKGGEPLPDPLYVHRMTCYLFGRERKVADVPTDHPSCSKQHAVLQYRLVEKEQPDGMMAKKVRPYLMDLDSTNGTFINDNRIEPRRYYELFEKDTIKFGNSSREYVLLHENSAE